ncbi:hypothetical protein ACFRAQ_34540 [Nocardia sp. NPDC056611]|uniref:hypothetical protein n=1 Tax=Nocardia sp. NPDC056611 TaxID=3345877 RepID=UPI00366E4C0F
MTATIDPDGLEREVRALAAEQPEFVYQRPNHRDGCVYVDNGCPSCLIGQAAARIGIPIAVLEDWDSADTTGIDAILTGDFGVDGARAEWFAKVQAKQDDEYTWRQAIEYADQGISVLLPVTVLNNP